MTDCGRVQRRILHTADLHIGWLTDTVRHGLEAVVNLAIKAKVDLVIIAGDLFDHNRVDDNAVSFAVEQLQHLPVPVIILPGNHDCLVSNSVYYREKLWEGATNIRMFKAPQGETFELPDLGIAVWGKPIISEDDEIHPLAGIPQPQRDGQWHIAVAHGYYVGNGLPIFPGFHITEEEIIMSGQDYIALGHWPVFRCVCNAAVKAYYCDTPYSTVNIVDFIDGIGAQVTRCSL